MLGALTSLALPALENLTGGAAAPATSGSSNNSAVNSTFNHGAVNFGSNNGVPTWAVVGALAIGGFYVYKKFK